MQQTVQGSLVGGILQTVRMSGGHQDWACYTIEDEGEKY